jgi:acetyl esterase
LLTAGSQPAKRKRFVGSPFAATVRQVPKQRATSLHLPRQDTRLRFLRRLRGLEPLERRELPANDLLSGAIPAQSLPDSSQTALVDTQSTFTAATVVAAPRITLGGISRYIENAQPLVLAPNATFEVGDARLEGGRLSIEIATNAAPEDRLALRVSATAINTAGSYLRYGDKVIGRIETATPFQLTVQFTRLVTLADMQALLRSVTFRTLGENPSPLTRDVHFRFVDSNGLTSNTALKQVAVQPVNDLPKVVIAGGQSFQLGQGAVVLAPNARLVDPDSADFNGGQLLVTIAKNIQPGDVLSIRNEGTGPGQISVSSGRLFFERRFFATCYGGKGDSALAVRFLRSASPTAVQQLLRNVTFGTWGKPLSTLQRSITFELSDRVTAETQIYKVVDGISLSLGIVKPLDWQATDRRPALVFVSSNWTAQSPSWWNERLAYFASRGIVCIRATGRIVPVDSTTAPDAPAQDIKSAMRWVRSHAAELGIDPARIGAVGASASGHLAALTAMIDGLNDPQDDLSVSAKANALLMFNGIVDTGPDGWGYDRVGERYTEFSPAENVSADDPPTFNVAGTADRAMLVDTVRRFQSRLENAGVRTDFHYFPGMEHGFANPAVHNGRYYYFSLLAADRFLASLGWLHGPPTILRPAADRIASGLSLPWYAGMKTVQINA